MTTTSASESDSRAAAGKRLDTSAAQLLTVARADAASPGAQLHCLAAVDLLRTAGANPLRAEPSPTRREPSVNRAASDRAALVSAVHAACHDLAGLPADLFARTPIANAAAHARRARELLAGD